MPIVTANPLSIGAILLDGKPTVIFPSRPYPRVIILVDMENGTRGPVTTYRGTPGGAFTRVFSASIGQNQQWTTPFRLPKGQGLYVQWDNTPTDLATTRATITWKEETR